MGVAVVTGAGGSLGRAIALRLAQDGHLVAVTDVVEGALKETVDVVSVVAEKVWSGVVDLRDESALGAFFDDVRRELGPVTVLVNNAAIYPTVPFLEMELSDYEAVHAVNQRGYWLCAQLAARQMTASEAGTDRSIVNVASITMHGGWEHLAAYVTTKGGAVTMARALARELGPHGIRVNAVSPGVIRTPLHPEENHPFLSTLHPVGRMGEIDDVTRGVLYLEQAPFVTGEFLHIDGGQSAGR